MGANELVVEIPEIPEVMHLDDGTHHTLSAVVGTNYDVAMQARFRIKDAMLAGAPLYACSQCGVPVSLLMHHQSRRLYFKHTFEDGRCSAVTRGVLNQDEIDARKYNGAKESRLHLAMKQFVVNSLAADDRFSDIQVEKRWTGALTGAWRKPDVQAMYRTLNGSHIRVAFEVQLSTTYLDVIVERRQFYLKEGGLLFWVFSQFNESGRRLTQDDVFFNNNQNAFIVNADTAAASVANNRFQLDCVWARPNLTGLAPTLERQLVAFDELTLDAAKQQAYFFDYYGERSRMQAAYEASLDPVRSAFETGWLTNVDKNYVAVPALWQNFYRGLRARGIILPNYPRDPDSALISGLYSAKHGRVVGWRYRRLIEVAHRLADAHPQYLRLFRAALRIYDRGIQIQREDKTKKWRNRVHEMREAMLSGDPRYDHDTKYDEALCILFPELYH